MSDERQHIAGPEPTRLRDRLACGIANFALNHIASDWYRRMIAGSIKYGLASAAIDTTRRERIVFDHERGEVRREVPREPC